MESTTRARKEARMDTPFKSRLDLNNVSQEVKSYIYQALLEFEPYTTENTLISVVAKDPLKLLPQYEAEGKEVNTKELKAKYRISISLSEDGSKIEEEAVADSIIEAVRIAKDSLLSTLNQIQNDAISNQDRTVQINSILQQTGTIH